MKHTDIVKYLTKYYSLFQYISDELNKSLNMDAECNLIDDIDYCGYDMSGDNSLYQLFYSGDCTYFPAIPLHGENINNITNLDEWPIYVYDLESSDEPTPCGNFRSYIKDILNEYIIAYNEHKTQINQSKYDEVMIALNELNIFSTKITFANSSTIEYPNRL